MTINIIGVDLAKEVFQVYAANSSGKKIWSRKLSRQKFKLLWKDLEPCTVVMESCGSSHYWGRTLRNLGFDVKLIPAKFVRPFVKTNKSDEADAEAIVVAALAPGMRFSAIKTEEQQSILALHRVRSRVLKQRIQISNEIRGFLREFGFTIPQGTAKFKLYVHEILEDAEIEIPNFTRIMINRMLEELARLEVELAEYDKLIVNVNKENEVCKRLQETNGVGPLSASALFASVANISEFKNGRALAAFLGLVPRHSGSGGKTKILGISKRGDPYLRSLLIHGGRSIVNHCSKRKDPYSLKINKLRERIGFNKTCVAVANRNARIAWVLMAKGEIYKQPLI